MLVNLEDRFNKHKKQRKTMGACRVLANVRVDFDVEHNIIYLILVYM